MMDHVARTLHLDPIGVRWLNLYRLNERDSVNTPMSDLARQCWTKLDRNLDLKKLQAEVDAYNRDHKWKKRGISENHSFLGWYCAHVDSLFRIDGYSE